MSITSLLSLISPVTSSRWNESSKHLINTNACIVQCCALGKELNVSLGTLQLKGPYFYIHTYEQVLKGNGWTRCFWPLSVFQTSPQHVDYHAFHPQSVQFAGAPPTCVAHELSRDLLVAAAAAEDLAAEPAVVAPSEGGELLVAVVALLALAVRHPILLQIAVLGSEGT